MEWLVNLGDLHHIQRTWALIKSIHRSDEKNRGPARGERGWRNRESRALLEVIWWKILERKVWRAKFAARTNLVVYLITTRKVVVFGC